MSVNVTSAIPTFAELVDGLRATFRTGRTRPLEWRKSQLSSIIRMIDENESAFVDALATDLGRPPFEAYAADLGATKAEVSYMLKHVDSWVKPRRVRPGLTALPAKARIVPEPLGVALVIAPWNYPIQLLLNPMAAAIAAGNCVVAKPSELAPACSAVLALLVPKYLDEQAITLVEGGVPETTALLELPYDHVFFTGSTNVGRVVMQAAAKHLTPVTLELGGKSPVIVAADADLDIAARRIMWGKHLNAGQTCIAPDYVLADAQIRDRLVEKMIEAVHTFVGKDPKASPDFSRIINARHFDRLSHLLATSGGTVALGGDLDPTQRFVSPTIVLDPDLESPLMNEEIFGPILPVLSISGTAEAIEFVNARPKPLALYVFSRSTDTADRVVAETSSGGMCINHTLLHILPPTLPFGGVGPSGMGAYHGKVGFDAFSHAKAVLSKPYRPDLKLLYPPYSALKNKLVRKAM